MALAKTEKDWAERAARHIKAELKRADLTYEDLADRLKKHGFKETEASITNKLKRGTFSAAFMLACTAALELEGVHLEDYGRTDSLVTVVFGGRTASKPILCGRGFRRGYGCLLRTSSQPHNCSGSRSRRLCLGDDLSIDRGRGCSRRN